MRTARWRQPCSTCEYHTRQQDRIGATKTNQILKFARPGRIVLVEWVLVGQGPQTGDLLFLSNDFHGSFIEDGLDYLFQYQVNRNATRGINSACLRRPGKGWWQGKRYLATKTLMRDTYADQKGSNEPVKEWQSLYVLKKATSASDLQSLDSDDETEASPPLGGSSLDVEIWHHAQHT